MAVSKMPNTGAQSVDAVLEALHEEAEHKASLKMYFAAADLYRDYHGPFAAETQAERVQLATEYEQRGRSADHEHNSSDPHESGRSEHWHCPACHTELPEHLVVCGKCGFDMRTGKTFVAGDKPWPEFPQYEVRNTKVTHARHHTDHRHEDVKSTAWLIAALLGIVVIVILLAIGKKHLTSQITAPPPAATSSP